jgi:hypothetical protein
MVNTNLMTMLSFLPPPQGHVYIIKNGNRFKIGKTKNDPKLRMAQLSLKESGELIYSQLYNYYHHIEKELHLILKDKRVENSEWFEDLNEFDMDIVRAWRESDKILK